MTESSLCDWLQLLQLRLPGSLWARVHLTHHPAASVPLLVSSRPPLHHLQHVTHILVILYLIHSKGQVCWRQPGVSSSNTNLAERHRRLLWRSPKEAWEGKPAAPGGWGWWRGWRKWHVKGQQKVRLNYYRCSHEFCCEMLVYLQMVSGSSDFLDHCSFIWVINWICSVFNQLAALSFSVSIKQSFWPKFLCHYTHKENLLQMFCVWLAQYIMQTVIMQFVIIAVLGTIATVW